MNAILILFLLGIIFLAFEVFMPGAVLGILGGLAMLAGCALAFTQYGFVGGFVATLVALCVLGLALFLEFYLLPRTRLGKQLFVQSTVDAQSQAPVGHDALIGKTARSITTLAPSGYVEVEGVRYEAFSPSGLVEKGVLLQVTGHDTFRLLVSKFSQIP